MDTSTQERAAAGSQWAADWAAQELVFASNLRRYFRRACTEKADEA